MRALMILIVMINLSGCAASLPPHEAQNGPDNSINAMPQGKAGTPDPTKPVRSPHGYIITKDVDLERFGGFVGECTDDQNWPYFWQCMSENSGNGGFK